MDAWSGSALSEFILEIHAEPERDPVDEIEISRDRGVRMNPLVGETSHWHRDIAATASHDVMLS